MNISKPSIFVLLFLSSIQGVRSQTTTNGGVVPAPPSAPVTSLAGTETFKPNKEEVTFQHGANTLSGVLFTPPGTGPFPVFVWCDGSGAATTMGENWMVKCFLKSGYGFLSWDKPGVGKSTGVFYQQSMTNRAEEVLAAVDMLLKRNDINPQRISFCGISQGGYVLPEVIEAFPQAEKLILISPGSVSLSEERIYQRKTHAVEHVLPMFGFTKAEVADFLRLWEKVDSVPDADFADAYRAFHQEVKEKSWYPKLVKLTPPPPVNPEDLCDWNLFSREAFTYDPVQEYSWVHCPALFLFGASDDETHPDVAIKNIRAGFAKSGNTHLSIIVYPGAGHGLNAAGNKPAQDITAWLGSN